MREKPLPWLLLALAPLLVWTAHFAFCYGWVAAQCSTALLTRGPPERMPMVLATLLALVLVGLLLGRSYTRLGRKDKPAGFADWLAAASAPLAMIGIIWTAVPLALLEVCG